MGLLNGMKDRLGFGSKPEWQDDGYVDDGYGQGYDDGYDGQGYDDEYADDGYDDQGYDDGYGQDGGYTAGAGRVVSFDAYNPDNFENVTLSSDREPRVASYDDLGGSSAGGYSSRSGSYGHGIGTSSSRRTDSYRSSRASSDASGASWANPDDPSFLDNKAPSYSRDIHDSSRASDAHSSLGSEFIRMHRDPATHLEIIRPSAYSDVEKIANAAKAGKSIVLVVSDTKPALAKRILDFTFGAASALNLNVDKAADRIFVISKGSEMLTAEEREYLKKKDILK